jgi:hypothetical protein
MSEEIQKTDDAKPDDGVIRVFIPSNKQTDETIDQVVRVQPDEDVQQTQPDEDVQDVKPSEDVEDLQSGKDVQDDQALQIEEVTDEDETKPVSTTEESIKDEVAVQETTTQIELPENVQKLVDFINETGGTIEDYVKLNQDVDKLNEMQLVKEYYKQTKPHLNDEEIGFLIEDRFHFDSDLDDEVEVKRKKLAFKEEASAAKKHLSQMKERYYAELKAGSRLTQEQQKAVDFFNRYNKEQESVAKTVEQQKNVFLKKTDEVFTSDFKGFEYSVGDKRYRFNVRNANDVKNTQSDINNFVRKFLNKENVIEDAKGYHKALFTAMNADAIASHFYEQGKADAIKDSITRSKNVDMNPRGQHEGVSQVGGVQVRAVSGESSSKLRVKFNK